MTPPQARSAKAGAVRHRSFRLPSRLLDSLERRARETDRSANALAQRYIDEGLRMDEHPGISFRDGAGGRRPCVSGTRVDVWQLIDTFRASDGSVAETARALSLGEWQVDAALRYYGAFSDEVDEFARRVQEYADNAEGLWLRAQEVRREAASRRAPRSRNR